MFSIKKRRKSFLTLLTYSSDITVLLAVFLQAVDVVGQAGKPKTITGFQTHTTPVLLAYGERAELATEECILCSFCHKPSGPSGRSLSTFLEPEVTRSISTPPGWDVCPSQGYPPLPQPISKLLWSVIEVNCQVVYWIFHLLVLKNILQLWVRWGIIISTRVENKPIITPVANVIGYRSKKDEVISNNK